MWMVADSVGFLYLRDNVTRNPESIETPTSQYSAALPFVGLLIFPNSVAGRCMLLSGTRVCAGHNASLFPLISLKSFVFRDHL